MAKLVPRISVIVPVYNVEQYLDQCMESLLGQTLADIEILLVNDASTDRSLEKAQHYARDPRVRVLDKPHGGLGDTRNWGVRQARGTYLSFVDSDDWLAPDALACIDKAAQAQQADIVFFDYVRENLQAKESRPCHLPKEPDPCTLQRRLLEGMIGPDACASPWREAEMLGSTARRVYRRAWFLSTGLCFPNEQEIMLEDLPLSIMLHASTDRVVFLEQALYHYRYNANSLSTSYRAHKMEMLLACYAVVDKFLKSRGMDSAYGERHLGWLLRNAAHSALVNCFSPKNPAGFAGRWQEVRGILRQPLVQRAAHSPYFDSGTKADRLLRSLIASGNVPAVYAFYSTYAARLRRHVGQQ